MAALLEAYITNLGKYAEGQLVGETLKFPTTAEEVQSLLKRIGVDGIRYEEIFITSFDGDVLGLHEHLGEYPPWDKLSRGRQGRPRLPIPAIPRSDRPPTTKI